MTQGSVLPAITFILSRLPVSAPTTVTSGAQTELIDVQRSTELFFFQTAMNDQSSCYDHVRSALSVMHPSHSHPSLLFHMLQRDISEQESAFTVSLSLPHVCGLTAASIKATQGTHFGLFQTSRNHESSFYAPYL